MHGETFTMFQDFRKTQLRALGQREESGWIWFQQSISMLNGPWFNSLPQVAKTVSVGAGANISPPPFLTSQSHSSQAFPMSLSSLNKYLHWKMGCINVFKSEFTNLHIFLQLQYLLVIETLFAIWCLLYCILMESGINVEVWGNGNSQLAFCNQILLCLVLFFTPAFSSWS